MTILNEDISKNAVEFKKKEIIQLVIRQTNYSEDEAIQKLKEWDNNYMNVIKEYIKPDFKKEEKEEYKSTNQKIMGEIRSFMDTVNREYNWRKGVAEMNKQRIIQYKIQCVKFLEKEIAEANNYWNGVPEECWKNEEVIKAILTNGWKKGLMDKELCGYHFKCKETLHC